MTSGVSAAPLDRLAVKIQQLPRGSGFWLWPLRPIWRPKAGFGAPCSWVGGALRPMVDQLLSASVVKDRGRLQAGEVRRIIAAKDEGSDDNALRIWAMMTLDFRQREFMDPPAR